MVILSEWHRTALEQKRNRDLPMTGEDTGLGASAPPLAGYLGKVKQRCASLEFCPWCAAKGLTFHVRSYRINYQETINLCTNPQCLFPLVSRPLENVLASLGPPELKTGAKRKTISELEKEEVFVPSPKRLRSKENDSPPLQNGTATHRSKTDPTDKTVDGNDKHPAPEMVREVDGYCQRDSDWSGSEAADQEALQEKTTEVVVVLEKALEHAVSTYACTAPEAVSVIMEDEREDIPVSTCWDSSPAAVEVLDSSREPNHSSYLSITDEGLPMLSSPHKAERVDEEQCDTGSMQVESPCTFVCRPSQCTFADNVKTDPAKIDHSSAQQPNLSPMKMEQKGSTLDSSVTIKSEPQDLPPPKKRGHSSMLVSVPHQLFWKNEHNLCWLDAVLVALVNCRTLTQSKPKAKPKQSSVWQLITGYDQACTVTQAHQQTKDGVVWVPNRVLQKVNSDLQKLRMSIFKLLQPKLQCQLGQRETPVFAIPLLLKMNSWAEPLFQLTFTWEFKCSDCKSTTNLKVTKPLPTFTNIVPDWHPLNAAHLATCNECCKKNQNRKMVLESVPPVLALHFVEGLPDNDVRIYSFSFQGKRYSVTTVLQYDQHRKHFVTWIRKSDGSWLEFDDLKHPDCVPHIKLPVPAQDIHIVFWERETDEELNHSLTDEGFVADELMVQSPDQSPDRSLFIPHNDSDIVGALTVSDDRDSVDTMVTAGDGDSDIGSTTLLDTFEGLTHNDIVTLTLVEVKAESEVRPFGDNNQTADNSLSAGIEVTVSSPTPETSGSPVKSNESPDDSSTELPSTPDVSDSMDDLSSDPTFEPGSKRGKGRGRAKARVTGRAKGKKAESAKKAPIRKRAKKAPAAAPSISSQHSEMILPTVVGTTAPADDPPPAVAVTALNASPVSSAETLPQPVSERKPDPPQSVDQNSRWSHLLSMHPFSQLPSAGHKPTPASIARRKPVIPDRSTPDLLRRQQQTPAGLYAKPKPQLRREDKTLPLKAAEIYDAFCVKNTKPPTPPQSPTLSQLPVQKTTPSGPSQMCRPVAQKPPVHTMAASTVSFPPPAVTEIPKISTKKHGSHSLKVPSSLSDTEALRYKLLKKLKAKKKKLEKLNQLLGHKEGAGGDLAPTPDSTDLSSPYSVSSSTYDQFFADLLSPATTTSSLSPDSTGLLEMLTNGQEGGGNTIGGASQVKAVASNLESQLTRLPVVDGSTTTTNDNILGELISETAIQRQTEMEAEALSALDFFF